MRKTGLAVDEGATGTGRVVRGDATLIGDLLPADLHGRVGLVLTSPPYGPTVHGQVKPEPGNGVHKSDNHYGAGRDKANLANAGWHGLTTGFTQILAGCATFLRPGGYVAVTARPWRSSGQLIDLPSAVIAAGLAAGLEPVERCVALLAALRDGRLIHRASFFQLHAVRRALRAGTPLSLIAHEDVLIFRSGIPQNPANPSSGA